MSRIHASALFMFALSTVACSDERDRAADAGPDAAADAIADADVTEDAAPAGPSIAETLGITEYVGAIDPIEESRDGNVTTYTFDPGQGPVCLRGAPFRASTRDRGSDDLVIFLQGGGACWSEFCLAVTGAPSGVPAVDILNQDLEANPTRDWNVVYLPYCDGSFFAGDAEHDDNLNDNGVRTHRGLANLTGALEVAAEQFPSAQRILLAGSSGGAYGLLLAGPLVRHYYPEAELIVMADSGIGLARQGEPEFIQVPVDEFDIGRFIPDDCDGCITSGHLTAVVSWYLERDANVRVGVFSSWYDSVLAQTFLQIDAERFATGLRSETDAVHSAFPDRFRRFVVDGIQHTSLLSDPSGIIGSDLGAIELPPGALQELLGGGLEIGGLESTAIGELTMSEWLSALIDNDLDVWTDLIEEPGPPPVDPPDCPEREPECDDPTAPLETELERGVVGVGVYETDVQLGDCEVECSYISVSVAVLETEAAVTAPDAARDLLLASDAWEVHDERFEIPLDEGSYLLCARGPELESILVSCAPLEIGAESVISVVLFSQFGPPELHVVDSDGVESTSFGVELE